MSVFKDNDGSNDLFELNGKIYKQMDHGTPSSFVPQIVSRVGIFSGVPTNLDFPVGKDILIDSATNTTYYLMPDGSVMVQAAVSNSNPVITTTLDVSVPENQTAVTTVDASDPNGDGVTYSISGGADAGLFNIDPATGVVSFSTAPDFELPADANSDNVYELTVKAADDKGGEAFQNIRVTVTDAIETGNSAPVISGDFSGYTTPVGGQTVSASAAIPGYTVIDPDGDTLTYSWVHTSGPATITFSDASVKDPDITVPATPGSYVATMTVSDGTNVVSQAVPFTVPAAANGAPVISGNFAAHAAPAGGQTAAASTMFSGLAASDPDGDALTYSWTQVSGPATVTFSNAAVLDPNVTVPADVGSYVVRLTVSDGTDSTTQDMTINVPSAVDQPITGTFLAALDTSGLATTNMSPVTDPDGTLTWSTDFGDGSPAVTGADPTHQYQVPGTYTITATATDPLGNAYPQTRSVIVTRDMVAPKIEGTTTLGTYTSGQNTGRTLSISPSVTDPQQTLSEMSWTWTAESGSADMALVNQTVTSPAITLQSHPGGTVSTYRLSVDDGHGNVTDHLFEVTWHALNSAPVIGTISDGPCTSTTSPVINSANIVS